MTVRHIQQDLLGVFGLCNKDSGNKGAKSFIKDIVNRRNQNKKANKGTNINVTVKKRNNVDWQWEVDKNGNKSEQMRKITLLIVANLFLSCIQNKMTTNSQLIGEWNNEQIILKISKNKFQRLENGNIFNYESYKIFGDTLKMYRQGQEEVHIIKIINNKLIFSPVNPFQKDIELIDESVFIKRQSNVLDVLLFYYIFTTSNLTINKKANIRLPFVIL